MAKVIKYKFLSGDASTASGNENALLDVTMDWNEVNEEIARSEAYNGEYTIEEEEV